MFKDTAVESLTLSIELFNRPSPLARDHAVIMMLAHSFEMLLKAIIFQKRGTVRDKGEALSHSLNRCIEISVSDLKVITADERTLLGAIKQDRDCATHDTIVMSEDLLWVHMRAGVSLFRRLLADQFEQNLSDVLPGRVIPVSASPPSDLGLLVENELQGIKELLAAGRRRTAEAAARLRPLLAWTEAPLGAPTSPPTQRYAVPSAPFAPVRTGGKCCPAWLPYPSHRRRQTATHRRSCCASVRALMQSPSACAARRGGGGAGLSRR